MTPRRTDDTSTAVATAAPTASPPTAAVHRAYRTLSPVARDFVRATTRSGSRRNITILRLHEEQQAAYMKQLWEDFK